MGNRHQDGPKRIGLADCAKLLGQPRLLLWWQSKIGKFAIPAGTENGRPFWHEDYVYRWAARARPKLIHRVPIRCWPDAERPATYHGAQEIDDVVVQTWETDSGMVCVMWSRPGSSGPPPRDATAHLPYADTLIRIQADFGLDGPGVSTTQPGDLNEWDDFGASWADLARVLGQPAPYWPYMLRIPMLLAAWKPGARPVTYPTIPEIDTTPLLRLAATLPAGSPAHEVLVDLASVTNASEISWWWPPTRCPFPRSTTRQLTNSVAAPVGWRSSTAPTS